jgi:RHS repeat-associated protein
VAYDTASGNVATFAVNGAAYTTPAGLDATLVKNGDGSYTLSFHQSAEVQIFGGDGNLVYDTDRNGNRLTFAYPDGRRVMTITATAGAAPANTATIAYGGPGGRVSSIAQTADGVTRTVFYSYDPNGITLNSVTDANGGVTTYGYDAADNVNQVTGPAPLNAVTKFTYDTSHRVLSVTRVIPGSASAVTSYNYATPGHTLVTDGDNHPATDYTIDTSGRVTVALDAKGHASYTNYGADAKVASTLNASGGVTTNTYTANNESLILTLGPGGETYAATFNNPTYPYLPDTGTDTMGKTGSLTYVAPGNVSQVTDALGNVTKYTYNADGTMAASLDPGNGVNATVYGYNAYHQLTSITPPTGNSLHAQAFTYDGFGRRLSATSGAGMTTTYSYDNLNRLRSETHSDASPTITHTYDADGNAFQVTDGTGTTTTGYNAANQLTTDTPPGGPTLSYGYDPAGNVTVAGGDGRTNPTVYHYDKVDQVDQVTEPNGNIDIFAYNADRQRSDSWDNTTTAVAYDGTGNNVIAPPSFAVHINNTYDTGDRLTETKTTRANSDTTPANRVADLTYSYNVPNPPACAGQTAGWHSGLRQTSTDTVAGQTTAYCYDPLGHLASATTAGGPTYSYGYDTRGSLNNDNGVTHSFNSANQLADTATTYDANGNLTASAATAASYNSINQTTAANGITNGYNGATQNDRTTVGVTTQTNGALGVQTDTTTGAATYYQRDPHGALISEITPGGEYYYAFDGQGSIIAIIDTTGVQRAAYSYDPYGAHATATALNGALPANPWRYTGAYLDPSGLYHLAARYYDPTTGRFTQQDPTASPGEGNLYTYAGGDPVNNSDPSGTDVQGTYQDPVPGETSRDLQYTGLETNNLRGTVALPKKTKSVWWNPTTWTSKVATRVGEAIGCGIGIVGAASSIPLTAGADTPVAAPLLGAAITCESSAALGEWSIQARQH